MTAWSGAACALWTRLARRTFTFVFDPRGERSTLAGFELLDADDFVGPDRTEENDDDGVEPERARIESCNVFQSAFSASTPFVE